MSSEDRMVADGESLSFVDPSWWEGDESDRTEKSWIPYQGPKGGEGWQNSENPDDVRYQEDPPGEVHEDYQEMAEDWGSESDTDNFSEGWEEATTHHMMSEDTSDVQAEASEYLAENLSVGSANFRDIRPQHLRQVGKRAKAMDDKFDLSGIDHFGDHGELQNNFSVDHRNTAGYFMADAGINEDQVQVVAKANSLDEPRSIGIDPEEWLVTNDRYQTVVHEVAHYLHFQEFAQREEDPRIAWDRYYDRLDSDEEEILRDEVSEYATTNAFEAVAEIATGLMYGHEFSDEVLAIYEDHGGPEVEDMGFEEVTWDEEPEDVTTLKDEENPYLVEAEIVEESFRRWASSGGDTVGKSIEKNWIPYVGPQGGEGWQNTQRPDDIRYVQDPPGKVSAGYDEDHWNREERVVAEADHELGYVSDESSPTLNVTTADEASSLAEAGASQGASSRHMSVATWRDPDGEVSHRAFVTNYGPDMERNNTGEKPLLGERAVSADSLLRNLGFGENLPNHFLNRQQRYLAVESKPGKEVRNAPDEWTARIDKEKAKDFAAAVMLAGNSDLHPKNILVNEDGTFYAVDLDKSGGDFVDGPSRFKRRGVDSILISLRDMGINMNQGELGNRAEKLANRFDTEEAINGVPNSLWSEKDRHQFQNNIRRNIEAAKEGRLL